MPWKGRVLQPLLYGVFVLCSSAGFSTVAHACGASGPEGVAYCTLAEHDEQTRPKWAVGASGLYTSTNVHFSRGLRGDETRSEASAAVAYMPSDRVTLQLGVGALLGGHLDMPDGRHDFDPGPAGLLGAAWRVVDTRNFVILSSVLSFSGQWTRLGSQPKVGYEAFDLRLGAAIGTTLFDVVRPYLPVRIFGGPIYWHYAGQAVTGTDANHYQVGLGAMLHTYGGVEVFAEGIPLGEKAVSAGVATTL